MKGEMNNFFKSIIEFNQDSIKGTFIEKNLIALNSKTIGKTEFVT